MAKNDATDQKSQTDLGSFVKYWADKSEPERLALAKNLKKAKLYKGTPSAKIDMNFYNALALWHSEYKKQLALDTQLGQPATPLYQVLRNIVEGASGSGSGSGSQTNVQKYISSKSQTASFLQPIAKDLLGRNLNDAELAKYTKIVNEWQKNNPSTTTQGEGFTTTQGGVDEQFLVKEEIAKTGEARTKRATDAYAMLMQELGGLQ